MDDDNAFTRDGSDYIAKVGEEFNLPNNIVSEYVLKSSQARNFMSHMLAGYGDTEQDHSVFC